MAFSCDNCHSGAGSLGASQGGSGGRVTRRLFCGGGGEKRCRILRGDGDGGVIIIIPGTNGVAVAARTKGGDPSSFVLLKTDRESTKKYGSWGIRCKATISQMCRAEFAADGGRK